MQVRVASLRIYFRAIYSVYKKKRKLYIMFDKKANSKISIGIQRGDKGSGPPPPRPGKTQNYIFSNTGPDPLKSKRSTKRQQSMLGHHRPKAKRHLNGVSLVLFGSSLPSQKKKKTLSELDPLSQNFPHMNKKIKLAG